MDAFKKDILSDPEDGITEICDNCNKLIIGWAFPNGFVTNKGILCKECNMIYLFGELETWEIGQVMGGN